MDDRILILDDEEHHAKLVFDLLRSQRYSVEMATDPLEALDGLRDGVFALVVLDYKMPQMDGVEFLTNARKINPEQPIIMVSGQMNTQELIKVANIGVSLVLEKPFDNDELLEGVNRFARPITETAPKALEDKGEDSEEEEEEEEEEKTGLQAKSPVKTYPDDLRYMVAESAGTQDFLQAVWESFSERVSTFVALPAGSEFELLARELAAWNGEGGKQVHFFPATQVTSTPVQDKLEQVEDDDDSSNVVAVDGVDVATDEQRANLARFVATCAEGKGPGKKLRFLYRLKDRPAAGDGDPDALQAVLAEGLFHLGSLRDRPADLAAYVARYLERFAAAEKRPGKQQLEESAIKLLLGYAWPGQFCELIETLRRAVSLGEEGVTAADEVMAVIRRNWGEVSSPSDPPDMAGFLAGRQAAYLLEVEAEVEDPRAALAAVGVDPSLAGDGVSLAKLPLQHTELLKQEGPL